MACPDTIRWIVRAVSAHPVMLNVAKALLLGLVLFVIIYSLERYFGASTRQYRSRQFFNDAIFWLWTGGGLNRLVFTSAILGFVGPKLTFLKLHPLNGLPTIPR